MADHAFPTIHAVFLKAHGRIMVDVEQYTFVFIGQPTDTQLVCVAEMNHASSRGIIDKRDYAAQECRRKAGKMALVQLRAWARRHPGKPHHDFWDIRLWPNIEANDRLVVEKFLNSLDPQIGLFPPDQDPLP